MFGEVHLQAPRRRGARCPLQSWTTPLHFITIGLAVEGHVFAEEELNGLYFAHSGLRYLILLAGVVSVVYGVLGIIGSRPHDKGMGIIGSAFAGLIHLQVLLGLGLVFAGRFYPAVWGHLILMVFAAVLAQLPVSVNRRRPRAQRSFWPYIICSALAVLVISGGIMAIGRSPFGSVAP